MWSRLWYITYSGIKTISYLFSPVIQQIQLTTKKMQRLWNWIVHCKREIIVTTKTIQLTWSLAFILVQRNLLVLLTELVVSGTHCNLAKKYIRQLLKGSTGSLGHVDTLCWFSLRWKFTAAFVDGCSAFLFEVNKIEKCFLIINNRDKVIFSVERDWVH